MGKEGKAYRITSNPWSYHGIGKIQVFSFQKEKHHQSHRNEDEHRGSTENEKEKKGKDKRRAFLLADHNVCTHGWWRGRKMKEGEREGVFVLDRWCDRFTATRNL